MLLRNWLMGQAHQTLRQAATQAASGASEQPRAADEQAPPEQKPAVCHVGLVFALGIEAGGLIDRLSGVILTEGAGFVAREGGLDGRRLVVIESGAGRDAAARATEALIVGHRPQWIVSAGFAGGLHESLALGDILMADQIIDTADRRLSIDFKFDRQQFESQRHLHVGRLLTAGHVLGDPQQKKTFGQRYDALAVDLESMAVADVCRSEKIRFLSIRVISDTVNRALPRDIDRLVKKKTTAGRLGAVAGALVRRPSSIKDLWQLKEDALVASERLATFLTGIVGQLR